MLHDLRLVEDGIWIISSKTGMILPGIKKVAQSEILRWGLSVEQWVNMDFVVRVMRMGE